MKIQTLSRTMLSAIALFCLQKTLAYAESLSSVQSGIAVEARTARSPASPPAADDAHVIAKNGTSLRPSAGFLQDTLHMASADDTASSTRQREQLGVNAYALGSTWSEVRVVPKLDRLLGAMGGWRQRLSDAGFDFTLSYLAETVGNVAGGRRQGVDYSHQVVMGTDFDLERMLGAKGLSFHMLGVQRAGRSVATDYLGVTGLTQPQEDYGVGGNVLYKLVYIYLEQKLFGGKLVVDVGHMPANLKFGTSYFACYALNNITCAHPTALSAGTKWRSWPFSQWGMMARLNPGRHLYAQAGFFEASATEGGRAGFNFSFAPLGYVIPMELGWEPAFGRGRLTGHYKIGGYLDTSDHPDPFTAQDGTPILLSHRPARIERQRGAWYVGADQMMLRYGAAKDQGLILFGIAGWDMGASLPAQSQYTVGIISQGMFPARVTDAISLFWSWQNVNHKITRLQEMQADLGYETLRGGVRMPQSSIQVVELTYTAFLTRGLKILPDLQYVIHPDATRTYPNAVEAGFRLLAQF